TTPCQFIRSPSTPIAQPSPTRRHAAGPAATVIRVVTSAITQHATARHGSGSADPRYGGRMNSVTHTGRGFTTRPELDELNAFSQDTAIQALGIVFTAAGDD